MNRKIFVFVLAALISSCTVSFAQDRVAAIQSPIEYTQPNGTKIEILLKGDESMSYRTTKDAYLILLNRRGYYCFAKVNKNLEAKASCKRVGIADTPSFAYRPTAEFVEKLIKE